MSDFLSKVPGWLVTLLTVIITWVANAAVSHYRLSAAEKVIEQIEHGGSQFAREHIPSVELRLESLEKREGVSESDIKGVGTALSEIRMQVGEVRGDLKLVLRLLDSVTVLKKTSLSSYDRPN